MALSKLTEGERGAELRLVLNTPASSVGVGLLDYTIGGFLYCRFGERPDPVPLGGAQI